MEVQPPDVQAVPKTSVRSRAGYRWTVGCSVALGCILLSVGFCWYYGQNLTINAYCMANAAYYLNQYMDIHDGEWPSSWDDLEKDVKAQRIFRRHRPFSFEETKQRVEIDFDVNPSDLRATDFIDGRATFCVVRLKAWPKGVWRGQEPNAMILEYLKSGRTFSIR